MVPALHIRRRVRLAVPCLEASHSQAPISRRRCGLVVAIQEVRAIVTMLERIEGVLKAARIAGGWDDETVSRAVLAELGFDEQGVALVEHPDPVPDEPEPGDEGV